jgi:protein-tyrosine-phosphatase
MPKTLFICYGNLNRSQIAEGYYNHFTKSYDAISAGVDPLVAKHFDRPTDKAIISMIEEGIDISKQTVKCVTPEMIKEIQKIYVLTSPDDCPYFVKDYPNVEYWNIPDPHLFSMEEYKKVRDLIKHNIMKILPH